MTSTSAPCPAVGICPSGILPRSTGTVPMFPHGREHGSQGPGTGFPSGWEQDSQTVGNGSAGEELQTLRTL
ncbi:hypothetical protein HMPREF9303_0033 [Prevotella denticola CRIS 18C-A]|uniref:Uncharacterized protein n=1 Tax=Prevotella denticola CRIS 18C-A TaxID=944557 RepID=F0H7S6_9BACT|nr:hypothetical protein HMPREF9303_0033 [Prevotella denticola CRIS 18C-A]